MRSTTQILTLLLTITFMSCSPMAEKENDWLWLFDGSSTDGWRGFNKDHLPEGWLIDDGTLKSLGIGGDIVFGEREFGEFDLRLEWKISTGGNSGIFYHVVEGEQYQAAYENAPEYQLIDDLAYPDPLEGWQQVAADYAMYPADENKKVKPAGEWNTSRIVFTKTNVEHYLNGDLVVKFVPGSADWHKRRDASKWADYPAYGQAEKGFIGLQEHPGQVWFRNIKIREL